MPVGEQAAVTDRGRALLATPCGEKHKSGIEIVAKFLGGAGWDVTGEMERTPAQCAELAAREWFGIAGLTISSADRLEPLARTIEAIRAASGRVFQPHAAVEPLKLVIMLFRRL